MRRRRSIINCDTMIHDSLLRSGIFLFVTRISWRQSAAIIYAHWRQNAQIVMFIRRISANCARKCNELIPNCPLDVICWSCKTLVVCFRRRGLQKCRDHVRFHAFASERWVFLLFISVKSSPYRCNFSDTNYQLFI